MVAIYKRPEVLTHAPIKFETAMSGRWVSDCGKQVYLEPGWNIGLSCIESVGPNVPPHPPENKHN